MANISAIKLPNGDEFNLIDKTSGWTKNTGTVTSVRVQATSPVQSSTSTASSTTLDTTISLANAYGDTKNPYGTKTANYVLAGPSSGSAAAPTFRKLVAADIPISDWAKASTKPSYNFSEIGSKPTTISGYGITNAYTKTEVDNLITNLPEPMIFKGSLGTGGTITSLPTAAATNEGYTYKVITAGTYASQAAKVGDTFISDGSAWVLIPSGDEPSGTVTSVKVQGSNGLTGSGTVTSSGTITISHAAGSGSSSSNSGRTYVQSITLDTYGHVTNISTATETVTDSDTKNTAGSNDTSSKIFLVGTTSQTTGSNGLQTYSHDTAYVGTDGCLYSGGSKVLTSYTEQYTGTVTSVAASGSNGVSISGSPITSSGTITIGLNLSTAINGLGEGTSPAQRTDYIVAQYAGGGTTTTSYHRRSLANIFAALNASDITTALGYTPYNSTNPNGYTTNTGTVTSITLKAGGGISLDTDNTAITTNGTRTISHADTSSQGSSSNSGRTYIQSITLDTYGHVTGISTATESVTNTDTKVSTAAVTSGTTYYPVVGADTTSAATKFYDKTGFTYLGTNGTTSAVGTAAITLGNSTASGTANNKQGKIILYGSNAKKATITLAAPSADIALALPTSTGTLALTSQIPTIPSSTGSATTGISIAAHTTDTIIGVQSTTTTASKVTVGTHATDYGVKSAGSASTWTFEEKTIPNVTSAGSASTWTFEEKTIPNVTNAGNGSASLNFNMDTTDTKKLKITFSHTHTAPTFGTAIKVQSKSGGSNGTAPTLGTAIKVQSKSGGGNGSAPNLGSKVLTVTASDVDVPIKNSSASTFVTSKTHTITDNGHTHTI